MSTGQVAIVTGASRGIGRHICIELARSHFSVIAVARTEIGLVETVRMMNEASSDRQNHRYIVADVTSESDVLSVFDVARREYGSVDVLVNNAGYVEPAGLLEMTKDNWDLTIATNLTAVYLCCREFVRMRKASGGRIINVASTAGLSPRPGWSAYAASKAGAIHLSLTLAEELRPYGVQVYCLAPGRAATSLRAKLAPNEDQSLILQPPAIGRFVSFLTGDTGRYLDGQTIIIRKSI